MLEENNISKTENKESNKSFINPTDDFDILKNIDNNKNSSKLTLIDINQEKLQKQEKLMIEDIEVYFPYKPYEKQLNYMTSIIKILNKKYSSNDINFNPIAALESPTGTGKTLCLLCSILAWVHAKGKVLNFSGNIIYSTRTHSQISQAISELNKTCYEPRIGILSSREFSCANLELKKSLPPSVLDIKCAREHKQCKYYKNLEFYSNKNFGNVDIEDILKEGKKKIFCPFYVEKMKIKKDLCDLIFMPYNYIFLKEIRESMDINLKRSILVIDEAHNVINNCEDAQSLEVTTKDFEEMMIDLREVYKVLNRNNHHFNENLRDPEKELEEKENKEEKEKIKKTKEEKDKKEKIEEKDKKEEKESIKENDKKEKKRIEEKDKNDKIKEKNEEKEKNNPEEDENDLNSENEDEKRDNFYLYNLNSECLLREIYLIQNLIERLKNKKEIFTEKYYNNKDYLEINSKDFLSIFLSTEEEIKQQINIEKKRTKSQKTLEDCFNPKNIEEKDEVNIEITKISKYITEQNINKHIFFINKVINIIIKDYLRRTKLSILLNLLVKISDILENENILNSYVFCLSEEKIKNNNHYHQNSKKNIKLNIYCFNAGIGFNDIIKFNPYSIILTSGTLAPFDILEDELKIKFDTVLENEHIIDESQYKFIIIKGFEAFNKKFSFNFEYNNRSDVKSIAALGTTILELCKSVKNGGILVYFTSFSYLNQCFSVCGDSGIISKISKEKTIYLDDKKNKNLIKDFKKNKNSILLSVFRGTSSEGIDFRDDFARMVICVGVPYASIVEEKVQLKKKYLDEINNNKLIEGKLSGRKWYLNDAISNVNQSLGRVLRHIYDYGILVCIDERYERKNIINLFSNWIRKKCEIVNHISDNFFNSIVKFYDEQEKKFNEIKKIEKNENENIINNNEKLFNFKIEDEKNNSESSDKNISWLDKAFKRRSKKIEYAYEESEDPDCNSNNGIFTDKNEKCNEETLTQINEQKNEINCEIELDNLTNKYLENGNIKQKSLLNKKTKPDYDILNNEDINPNILNTNIIKSEDIIISNKEKNSSIDIGKEAINIKNSVKNFANEIDNFKFDDYIPDFNSDKIKETQKELDNNDNVKKTNEDQICTVCYEIASTNPELKYSLSKCNHTLCNICWSKTLNEKFECPICRKKVRVKTLKRLIIENKTNDNNLENQNQNNLLNKNK